MGVGPKGRLRALPFRPARVPCKAGPGLLPKKLTFSLVALSGSGVRTSFALSSSRWTDSEVLGSSASMTTPPSASERWGSQRGGVCGAGEAGEGGGGAESGWLSASRYAVRALPVTG